jgi:tetratricopeptide (TPR) repeat protein
MKQHLLAIAALLALSGAAQAATLTYGDSTTVTCARAAQAQAVSAPSQRAALNACNAALKDKIRAEDRTATLVNRGILLSAAGNTDAAIADFNAALDRNPALGDAYISRGGAQMRAGRFVEARADFDRALAMGTDKAVIATFNRGMANEKLGDLAAAYRDYRQAQTIAPDFAPARAELARFQVTPNRFAQNR